MTTTFFFEQLQKDEGRRAELEIATDTLRRIGLPAALLEMSGDIAATVSTDGNFRDAFYQGYRRCIRDIFFFRQIYVESARKADLPAPHFNAVDHLLNDGSISKKEAEDLRKRQSNAKPKSDPN